MELLSGTPHVRPKSTTDVCLSALNPQQQQHAKASSPVPLSPVLVCLLQVWGLACCYLNRDVPDNTNNTRACCGHIKRGTHRHQRKWCSQQPMHTLGRTAGVRVTVQDRTCQQHVLHKCFLTSSRGSAVTAVCPVMHHDIQAIVTWLCADMLCCCSLMSTSLACLVPG